MNLGCPQATDPVEVTRLLRDFGKVSPPKKAEAARGPVRKYREVLGSQ